MDEPNIVLPGGDGWRVWRWAVLRGAGFSGSMLTALAAPDARAAADRFVDARTEAEKARTEMIAALRRVRTEVPTAAQAAMKATKLGWNWRVPPPTGTPADAAIALFRSAMDAVQKAEGEYRRAFDEARATIFRATQQIAADPRFREAVTWQNRAAVSTGIASLLRASPTAVRAKDRLHEMMVANYAQRYCAKNDTIGFFGPVGWARLEDSGPPIVMKPHPELLASRTVFFEQWGIDLLAEQLSKDPELSPWMAPRRFPFVHVEGAIAISAVSGRHELGERELLALRVSDGTRAARMLARELIAGHAQTFANEQEVFETLRALREKGLVAWAFEVPLGLYPEKTLRRLLECIDDAPLRQRSLASLDALEQARGDVSRAAGTADALDGALAGIETKFTELTGAPATRHAGAMYAARQLVFEDCRRGIDASLGPEVLAHLGPPLSLVLASARWFTYEMARAYRAVFRGIYDDLVRRKANRPVRFADLWFRAQRSLFGAKNRPVDAIVTTLQEKWTALLPIDPSARRAEFTSKDVGAAAREAFAAPHAGWRAAREHSPDIMIASPSVEAIARGELMLVLGEIHTSLNTIDYASFLAQHANPEELARAYDWDIPEPLVLPVYAKDSPRMTAATTRAFLTKSSYLLETGFDPAAASRDRVLALADLVIHDVDGELVVPIGEGPPMEIVEVFGRTLTPIAALSFQLLPKRDHTPRITIDRLVIAREAWTLRPDDLAFAFENDESVRFAAARRWMRERSLPRFLFAKAPFEVKPLYVDLDSPLFVNMLAKLVRNAKEHPAGETPVTITEMLPTLDDRWLPDASGERFTSELRIVAVDMAR